jgi:predicted ArsR family transcriptional regulator
MRLLTDIQTKIVDLLKMQGRLSINQVTSRLDGSKTAIRRNLLILERRGVLEKEWIPTSRGRPQLGFRLTSQANVLFPSKEVELLSELIGYLQKSGNSDLVDHFFEEYWEKRYQAVVEKIKARKARDFSSRLEALMEVLEDEGFSPRSWLSHAKSELRLTECHCPIAAAAQMTSFPCHLEKRLIERILQSETEITKPCEFRVKIRAVIDSKG